MNTHASDQSAAAVQQPSAAAPSDSLRRQRHWLMVLAFMFLGVIIAFITHLWLEHQETVRLREELARRLQAGDTVSAEVKGLVKSMQDTVLDLQGRTAALETRQSEARDRYTTLQQMYQELSGSRDDRILTDMEQILLTANQQLQLSGNVHGALITLENADKLLTREDKPQFIGIRRAL
ncbi:MAG: uroporphyrinogen-III C-methyltransferase, partial [Burkholderiaceae bacterium]|nr:uroporphyrinogen-III C-methyltransferase [Burkholderiaceae bacterium]